MCRAIYCALTLLFSGANVAAAACDNLTTLEWLEGEWLSQGAKRDTLESWRRVSPGTFEGTGMTFDKNGQQQSQETLRLLKMGDKIYYLAKVSNNTFPVAFEAVQCSERDSTFENKQHDFPNRLHYSLSESGLEVKVTDNQGKGFTLHFKRKAQTR